MTGASHDKAFYHCVNCRVSTCIRIGCKRDRSQCPCAEFHYFPPAKAAR